MHMGYANLNPWTESKVNIKNPARGPLLIIEGEKDRTVALAIANAASRQPDRRRSLPGEALSVPPAHIRLLPRKWLRLGLPGPKSASSSGPLPVLLSERSQTPRSGSSEVVPDKPSGGSWHIYGHGRVGQSRLIQDTWAYPKRSGYRVVAGTWVTDGAGHSAAPAACRTGALCDSAWRRALVGGMFQRAVKLSGAARLAWFRARGCSLE
jgi:hypothetical protein